MARKKHEPDVLNGIPLGSTFTFRTVEILGPQYVNTFERYEGRVLTVVGFERRLKNNIVVRDATCGCQSLMPWHMVLKALELEMSRGQIEIVPLQAAASTTAQNGGEHEQQRG